MVPSMGQEADASPQIQEMAAWLTENAPHLQDGLAKSEGKTMSISTTSDVVHIVRALLQRGSKVWLRHVLHCTCVATCAEC